MNLLPDELLLEIFWYLDEKSIFLCRCVCRKFNNILHDRTIHVFNDHLNFDQTKLEEIFINSCKNGSILGLNFISQQLKVIHPNVNYHGLWERGLIIAVDNEKENIIPMISRFGVVENQINALELAMKKGYTACVKALLKEFNYSERVLLQIRHFLKNANHHI